MIIVGLSGGIASGKSTVSTLLQHASVPLVDLDKLARAVVAPDDSSGTLRALVKAFGDEILTPTGELDRPALGRIAFGDDAKRATLNRITHGAIRRRMAWTLVRMWLTGERLVVVDAPLLVEAGLWKWCARTVIVWCSPEDQLSRMLSRDAAAGLTEDDARSRLAAQHSLASKLPYADVILDNSSALQGSDAGAQGSGAGASPALRSQVQQLVQAWRRETTSLSGTLGWLVCWLVPPMGLLAGLLAVTRHRAVVERRRRDADTSDAQAIQRRRIMRASERKDE